MAQLETAVGSDKTLTDLWSAIQADELWKGRTGRGVRVGIIDSGVDTNHPELAGKIKSSYQAVNEGGQIVFKESTTGDQAGGHPLAAEAAADGRAEVRSRSNDDDGHVGGH